MKLRLWSHRRMNRSEFYFLVILYIDSFEFFFSFVYPLLSLTFGLLQSRSQNPKCRWFQIPRLNRLSWNSANYSELFFRSHQAVGKSYLPIDGGIWSTENIPWTLSFWSFTQPVVEIRGSTHRWSATLSAGWKRMLHCWNRHWCHVLCKSPRSWPNLPPSGTSEVRSRLLF